LLSIFNGVPQFVLEKKILQKGISIVDLLGEKTGVFTSKGEVRRMIKVRKQWISLAMSNLSKKKLRLESAEDKLQSIVQSYLSSESSSSEKLKNANSQGG